MGRWIDASSKSWFENFDSGNYLPNLGSPLIGAGDASFGTEIDIDGKPRVTLRCRRLSTLILVNLS